MHLGDNNYVDYVDKNNFIHNNYVDKNNYVETWITVYYIMKNT